MNQKVTWWLIISKDNRNQESEFSLNILNNFHQDYIVSYMEDMDFDEYLFFSGPYCNPIIYYNQQLLGSYRELVRFAQNNYH